MNDYNDFSREKSLPKRLTKKEFQEYFQLMENGDENAKMKIIEHNLRLVAHIVKNDFSTVSNENSGVDKDDLMSIGSFALRKSIDTFDIEKGIAFSTYAGRIITTEILMALRKSQKYKNNVSLDQFVSVNEDGDGVLYKEILASKDNVEEEYIQLEMKQVVCNSLEVLNDLERKIIEMHYGFSGEVLTHNQIGQILNVSQSYVSRIDIKAREKIRVHLEKQGIIGKKEITDDMKRIAEMTLDERILFYARTIVDTNITVEELSKKAGVTSFSIRRLFSCNLPSLDSELHNQVCEILEQHKLEEEKEITAKKEFKKQLRLKAKEEKQRLKEQNKNSYGRRAKSPLSKEEIVENDLMKKVSLDLPFNGTNKQSSHMIGQPGDQLATDSQCVNLDFERHKHQIETFINTLDDPTEQMALLLRLGYVGDQYFTEQQIGQFLNIDESEISGIINRGISNMLSTTTISTQDAKSVGQLLNLTRKPVKNSH